MVKTALSLLSLGCTLPPISSFGFIESFPTHLPCIKNVCAVCNGELPMDIHLNFHLLSEQSKNSDGFAQLVSDYDQLLVERPYATKITTGVVLAIVGDAIAQLREDNPYDGKRAVAFAMFDASYRAVQQLTYPPLIAEFQGQHILGFLAAFGYGSSPVPSAVFGPLEQTLISQLVIIPTVYYPVFFIITGFVQGLTFQETLDRAKTTFIPLMKRNLLFWIPVQFIAFAYIPQDQQISVLIACGLVWTVILSVSAGAIQTNSNDENRGGMPYPEAGMSDIDNTVVTNKNKRMTIK